MTKSCDDFRQQIAKDLLDDLSPQDRDALENHLAKCPACALEKELMTATVRQLRSPLDVSVPRHFFVYPAARQFTPWRMFQQMSSMWRFATAAVALLLMAGAGLMIARLQVRAQGGVYSVSFGKMPMDHSATPPTVANVDALKQELLTAVEEKLRTERLQWVELVQSELRQSTTKLNQQQRQLFRTALEDLETRLNSRMDLAQTVLEKKNDQAFLTVYDAFQSQREQDLTRIYTGLTQMVARGAIKERQTDAILNTLLEVAELKTQ
jgi:Putative zinc-finger